MAREPGVRREAILGSAAALFASKGVAATTVRQIADDVGILSGSLYHHFDSKESMVDEIVSSFLRDLQQRYAQVLAQETDARQRLHDLIVASLEVVEAHPHATEIYQNDVNYLLQFDRFDYLRNAGREVQTAWLTVIEAGLAEGTFRADVDPKILYRLMRDAVWLSVRWFKPSADHPTSRLAEDCTSLFLDGLTNRARN
ncbi:TetR/AcrR family transcriptional regulator [Micromonospora sp. DT46]|uniref:TetR/AcrR family transcriptional regulator n=1 Tax=unclassified Micromonospora TaxID=2617518 RepID=UPI00124B2707|nr:MULTISPECIES: TetR/AcrR family transcriptional regulator [unclassified Micromonospora]KAB1162339.1 TetR/AcrR family transcriptional regulator [Micromonospora sp. AMSO12t]WSG01393.1 TetR/AcrR family transcriptional regulator [Micromonospora sp. NBC_01740]